MVEDTETFVYQCVYCNVIMVEVGDKINPNFVLSTTERRECWLVEIKSTFDSILTVLLGSGQFTILLLSFSLGLCIGTVRAQYYLYLTKCIASPIVLDKVSPTKNRNHDDISHDYQPPLQCLTSVERHNLLHPVG